MSNSISSGEHSAAAIANEYGTRVARLSLDQQQQNGESALALIAGAAASAGPKGSTADGKGSLVDTYA